MTAAITENCCSELPVDAINRSCLCLSLDPQELRARVASGSRDPRLSSLLADRPGLYAATAVFLSIDHYRQMAQLVEAVAKLAATPAYQTEVQRRDPTIDLGRQRATNSLLMGYDFHISAEGPRLIEINTNAGAAFLTKQFADSGWKPVSCGTTMPGFNETGIDAALGAMFLEEWASVRPGRRLRAVAIVDEAPCDQYLYPEMLLVADFLETRGIRAVVTDPAALTYQDGQLSVQGDVIDMVYNRLTDFRLDAPGNRNLRQAYDEDAVVLSPSPRHHALYADKRNLILLGADNCVPGAYPWLSDDMRRMIPETRLLSTIGADAAWRARKQLFFKPSDGFGSRAAYRGDKITRQVWQAVRSGDYVAQHLVAPGLRGLTRDGAAVSLKYDVRLYAYAGKPIFPVARIYAGQTTNFRTPGGGLAPVILV